MPVIARYALATLTPLVLLFAGAIFGGPFGLLALVWLTLIAAAGDVVLARPMAAEDAAEPWDDRLSALLGAGHLVLLPLVVLSFADPARGFGSHLALFFATASFLGQISHPNAHELIHRRDRLLKGLGAAVYTTMLFGHHVSAHRLVHHRHVGTAEDPNTPLPGEGFWTYLPRAWRGSFEAGLAEETGRLARKGHGPYDAKNPYYLWVGGAALSLMIAAEIGGAAGFVGFLGLAGLAHLQILLSDYIQHYGLHRLTLPNGRIEPVGPHHSWNAPRGFTSYLMMNAPSHSDHHLHPDRHYDALHVEKGEPVLPYSLPIMAVIATQPRIWRRMMDKRADRIMSAAEARIAARGAEPQAAE